MSFVDVLDLNFSVGIDQCPSRVDLDSVIKAIWARIYGVRDDSTAPFTLLLALVEHFLVL